MTDAVQAKAEWERILSEPELATMLEAARCPAVHLRKTPAANDPGAPGCWLGGEPTLPAEIDWPHYGHPDQPQRRAPMHFMGQINLAQVPRVAGAPELPNVGTLFFFFDPIFAPFDDVPGNAGCVIYVEGDVSHLAPRATPDFPQVGEEDGVAYPYLEMPTQGFRHRSVTFEPVTTVDFEMFQNAHFWKAAIAQSQENYEKLARRAGGSFAFHRLLGEGCKKGWTVRDAARIPLLTLSTDGDMGFVHGEGQSIVFWNSPEDLQNRNFENAYFADRLS